MPARPSDLELAHPSGPEAGIRSGMISSISRLMAAVSAGVGTSGAVATVAGLLACLASAGRCRRRADASSGEGRRAPASST
jgi:hypothetical protein